MPLCINPNRIEEAWGVRAAVARSVAGKGSPLTLERPLIRVGPGLWTPFVLSFGSPIGATVFGHDMSQNQERGQPGFPVSSNWTLLLYLRILPPASPPSQGSDVSSGWKTAASLLAVAGTQSGRAAEAGGEEAGAGRHREADVGPRFQDKKMWVWAKI